MSIYKNLISLCAAFVFALGLAACSSGSDAPAPEPEVTMPEPVPDPGPTDLEETQMAAAAAATAAGEAATAAAASAMAAADATATLATLQTGADANADEMGGREAAMAAHAASGDAMAAYETAKAAAAAAAAATTAPDAEAAWADARAARDEAQAAAAMAADMSDAAVAAAMTELHIDGTMKWMGDSSVDATSDMRTSPGGVITGWLDDDPERSIAAVDGEHFIQRTGPSTERKHKQAVEAGMVVLGKKLDTSDDMARLALFTHRETARTVRVFTNHADTDEVTGLLTNTTVAIAGGTPANVGLLAETATAKSIGLYYLAEDQADLPTSLQSGGDDEADLPTASTATPPAYPLGMWGTGHLDAYDVVQLTDDENKPVKGVEIFELSVTDATTGVTTTRYARVEHTQTGQPGDETYYQLVDITADQSMTDSGDPDEHPQNLSVTVSIPIAEAYSHIHFGVWAGLIDEVAGGDNSRLAELGTGFVQNFSGSGVTPGNIVGTATYSGDWVASVRRKFAEDAEKGAIMLDDGHATLIANFSDDTFEGNLAGLATLKGSLSGNSFSGKSATAIAHADLEATGSFSGSFAGNVYGPDGAEAAGVFSFDGKEAGAFTGAFGGRDIDQ